MIGLKKQGIGVNIGSIGIGTRPQLGGALCLNLTNTADLEAWLTKYTGSYTRSSSMFVFDYAGVLQEVANNVYPIYGGRLSGGIWYNTEVDGATPLENIIGMASWPTTTNAIGSAQYRDFTHADWNVTNGSITAGTVVLIDGTSVDDENTFTASAGNATIILDPYTSASGVHAGGCFIKRKTGTGDIEVTIDGGSTWVDVTTQVDSDSGWHLAQTTLPTVTDPEFGVRLVTDTDAVYLDWGQLDDGYARVSVHPIPGGDTLAAQSLIAADATNAAKLISDTKGSVYVEAMLMPDIAITTAQIVWMDSNRLIAASGTDRRMSYDGTNVADISPVLGYQKSASYWGGLN